MTNSAQKIPSEELAEQWFGFMHTLIGKLQSAFREARASEGLTQKIIAERLGKKPEVISRCLSGQQNMTVRTMYILARAMGYRLEVGLRPLKDLRPGEEILEAMDAAAPAKKRGPYKKLAAPTGN